MDMRGRCLPEKIKRCGKNVGVKLIPPIGYYCWRLGRNIGIICKAELYSMWWIKERTWWEVNTTNLRMYFFPIVLNINHSFSNLEETLTHFNQRIQCNYLGMTEMPNKAMTYLRMYCFPIVFNINHSFSNLEETLTHFNQVWIFFIDYIYIIIILIFWEKVKKEIKMKRGGGGGTPKTFV